MKFHCAMIDTLLGFNGTTYEPGVSHAGAMEAEIIEKYAQTLKDCLEQLGIQFEVIETRKKPGFPEMVRLAQITAGKLGLRCGLGKTTNSNTNACRVTYTHPVLQELAEKLVETCFKWGKKIVPSFENGGAVFVDGKDLPAHIILEPFAINGLDAFIMTDVKFLDALSKELGKELGDWMKNQNPLQVGYRPKQMIERPWETADRQAAKSKPLS